MRLLWSYTSVLVLVTSVQGLLDHKDPGGASSYVLKSSYTLPPSLSAQWERLPNQPARDHLLDLRFSFAAQPENTRLLHDTLFSNHPDQPHWTRRRHLSRERVARLASPHPDSLTRFRAYLSSHGIDPNEAAYQRHDNETISSVLSLPRISIELAERLFHTRYAVYKHRRTGKEIVRALSYSLPREVHSDIEWVQPTNYFGSIKAHRTGAFIDPRPKGVGNAHVNAVLDSPNSRINVTLAFLQNLYNTTGYTPSVLSGNMLGITGYVHIYVTVTVLDCRCKSDVRSRYLEEYANLADLKQFYSLNLPSAINSSLQVITLNGAINSQNTSLVGLEANLDTQYGGAMSYPIPNVFYSVYGRGANVSPNISYEDNGNEPYDVLLSYLLAKDDENLPSVLSNSYGESEDQVPVEYAQSVCEMYAQLGARGVSVLHSSGDWGVGYDGDCGSPESPIFRANFPASCPL